MPELPEVETVARLIRPEVEGRRIIAADVHWLRTLGGLGRRKFRTATEGARIARVWRRAKFIVFDLEREGFPAGHLFVHLRMTGRLFVEQPEVDPGPHTRVSLELDGPCVLHFVDVRKFGRMRFARELDVVLGELGPEPLSREFTPQWLRAALKQRKRLLKPLLLDQTFLAGLGNIYVDEALHRSGLHPLRRSDRVAPRAAGRLCQEIRATLEEAIAREGSSFDSFYRTPEGRPGSYQHQFLVYGREGQPCRRCGAPIAKLVIAQRGTHVCRRCQPRPRSSQGRSARV